MEGFYFHLLSNLLALLDVIHTECIHTTLQMGGDYVSFSQKNNIKVLALLCFSFITRFCSISLD